MSRGGVAGGTMSQLCRAEQVRDWYVQSLGQRPDFGESDLSFSAFDEADDRAVEPSLVGKLFLAQILSFA